MYRRLLVAAWNESAESCDRVSEIVAKVPPYESVDDWVYGTAQKKE